jgi:hypothetical protein
MTNNLQKKLIECSNNLKLLIDKINSLQFDVNYVSTIMEAADANNVEFQQIVISFIEQLSLRKTQLLQIKDKNELNIRIPPFNWISSATKHSIKLNDEAENYKKLSSDDYIIR